MSNPPLCHFEDAQGRRRSIRTDDVSGWLALGYSLVDCTHGDEEQIKKVRADAKKSAPKAPARASADE